MKRAKLRKVQQRAARVDAAERDLHRAVHEAVEAGVTWREIGELFGMSRQSAHKRFSKEVDDAEG